MDPSIHCPAEELAGTSTCRGAWLQTLGSRGFHGTEGMPR